MPIPKQVGFKFPKKVLLEAYMISEYSRAGSNTKACPVALGKFNSKKHGFRQVHGLI